MGLVYDDEGGRAPFRGGGKPVSEWSPESVMGAWRQHVDNLMYLRFMAASGTFAERRQAEKELQICGRKLAFWERHPAFDKDGAARVRAEVDAKWSSPKGRRR